MKKKANRHEIGMWIFDTNRACAVLYEGQSSGSGKGGPFIFVV